MLNTWMNRCLVVASLCVLPVLGRAQNIIVQAEELHTVSGEVITDGVVLIADGKIVAVGKAADVNVPADLEVVHAKVVTPGLIDAHSVVGIAGYLNQKGDQDQLERSESMQPELRAIDAYNAREPLIDWVRSFGVTTLHTGHGPGAVISGQTMIVKTTGTTVDQATLVPCAMIAATLGGSALRDGAKPGTRGKEVAMLRAMLLEGQAYIAKQDKGEEGFEVNLRLDAIAMLLRREVPLLVTADEHRDIMSALRVAREFNLRLVLDSASDAHLLRDEIAAAGVPVILHATMKRAQGDAQNLSYETAARLDAAGIPFALQSGFESYVPKTRVVLFEAGVAAAHGLGPKRALHSITLGAAQLLGIEKRVGSIEVGKDGDLALYDGDPFEYTTHCVGTVIDGRLVSEGKR